MPLPYDAVLFDLDGTLTESEPGITKSVQYALDALGITGYDQRTLKSFIGPPLIESYVNTMRMDEAQAMKGVELYRERFSKIGWMENSVYTGIPLLLRSLKRRGAYIALASAKPEMFTKKILAHFGLIRYFDKIVTAPPDEKHADKAALVREALPETFRRACMVGDRKFDVDGALKNGIDAIGVAYGYGSREELARAGAAILAEDVSQLAKLLMGGEPLERGLFITLEGSDGCGKSTQMKPLSDWLIQCGHDLVPTREPGGSPVAERIREVVLDVEAQGMTDLCEALLFAASRAQHVEDVIKPSLAAGKTVLCDRYVDSSIAYQGVARGLGIDLVWGLNAPAVADTMPDLTILFDIDPVQALGRRTTATEPDRIEVTDPEFMRLPYNYYKRLAKDQPERVKAFDATGTEDEVTARLKEFITPLL